jgi:hypothetical protein
MARVTLPWGAACLPGSGCQGTPGRHRPRRTRSAQLHAPPRQNPTGQSTARTLARHGAQGQESNPAVRATARPLPPRETKAARLLSTPLGQAGLSQSYLFRIFLTLPDALHLPRCARLCCSCAIRATGLGFRWLVCRGAATRDCSQAFAVIFLNRAKAATLQKEGYDEGRRGLARPVQPACCPPV